MYTPIATQPTNAQAWLAAAAAVQGTVADDDHGGWYSELFAPSVTAGLMQRARASDLSRRRY
jgi:hypothetical protein